MIWRQFQLYGNGQYLGFSGVIESFLTDSPLNDMDSDRDLNGTTVQIQFVKGRWPRVTVASTALQFYRSTVYSKFERFCRSQWMIGCPLGNQSHRWWCDFVQHHNGPGSHVLISHCQLGPDIYFTLPLQFSVLFYYRNGNVYHFPKGNSI